MARHGAPMTTKSMTRRRIRLPVAKANSSLNAEMPAEDASQHADDLVRSQAY